MNRKELENALELPSRALAANNLVPAYQCFMFDEGMVTAYNDELAIVAPCNIGGHTFGLNGAVLMGLVKNCQAEEIDFTLEKEDVLIKSGRSTFRLPYITKEEYLFDRPVVQGGVSFPLTKDMTAALTNCLMTSSTDNTKPAMMGVFLKLGKLYSCDGDAVTRVDLQIPLKVQRDTKYSYLMPNSFCEAVTKIFSDEDKTRCFSVNDEWAVAFSRTGDLTYGHLVYGRIIAVENPLDHEELIKSTMKDKPDWAKVPDGLNHALSRARVVADAESAPTNLKIEGGRMKLVTETKMGTVRDSIKIAHLDVEASVSAALLQRSTDVFNEFCIFDNCVVFKQGNLFQLVSNL